jgi:uncharacterized protein
MPDEGSKEDGLEYNRMVQKALLGVVGESLKYAAKHGLADDHHFYITFRTDDPGTRVPKRLRERYPNEMTIVLQYQFSDLEVTEEGFSVTLSFGEIPETLIVPFAAVVAFADPSVQFGLQFDTAKAEGAATQSDAEQTEAETGPDEAANGADADKQQQDSDKVVSFDTFRRKQT